MLPFPSCYPDLLFQDEQDGKDGDETNLLRKKVITAESTSGPAFGKPEIIEESLLPHGQMIPLKKIEYGYDSRGNRTSQKVFDSQNRFCYIPYFHIATNYGIKRKCGVQNYTLG